MSNIEFIDENKTKAKIKVIGVGGCGGNATNAMLSTSLAGEVGLYAVNTDVQALQSIGDGCECVQIGQQIAKGLGVGADYKRASQAAEQDSDRIEEIVSSADMVFIAAGMGGGTGTGAAPVIAQICRDKGILTVSVVTKPFWWEKRDKNTQVGIEMLSRCSDSIIIVPNDRISEVYGDDLPMKEAFKHSDSILSNAVAGICEIIYCTGRINVDFADVRAVMSETGQAMMGTASERGVDRAARAAREVIDCPLLEGVELDNARGLLVNITMNDESFKQSELHEIMNIISGTSVDDAKIFCGLVHNQTMGDELRITLVATGLGSEPSLTKDIRKQVVTTPTGSPKILRSNRGKFDNSQGQLTDAKGNSIPAMLRRQHN